MRITSKKSCLSFSGKTKMQLNPTQPNLINCRRLFLDGYEVNMSIVLNDHEKNAKQLFISNIDLYIPLDLNTPKDDRLEEFVDYQFMRETVNLHAHNGLVQLQETLCLPNSCLSSKPF